MINVHPYMDGSIVCDFWYTYDGPIPLNAVYIRDMGGSKVQNIGLRPFATRKSRLENRSCTHDNWSGDAYWSPNTLHTSESVSTPVSGEYPQSVTYLNHTITPDANDPSNVKYATVFITPESSGQTVFPAYRMILRGTTYYKQTSVSWSIQGDTVTTYRQTKTNWTSWGTPRRTWTQNVYQFVFGDGVTSPLGRADRYYGARTVSSWDPPTDWPAVSPLGTVEFSNSTRNHATVEEGPILDKSSLRLASNWLRRYIPTPDINRWGDLCQSAIQDARSVDINSLQFVRELFELKDSILGWLRLLRGKATPKSVSKAFLGLRYGLNLTLKDTEKLKDAITSEFEMVYRKYYRYCRAQAQESIVINSGLLQDIAVDQYFYYKIYYDPVDTGFRSLIRKLMNWDVFPTFQNIWDLIPLSFVLDWFMDFENYFDIVDTGGYIMYLKVIEAIETRKTVFHSVPLDKFLPVNMGSWNLSGSIDYTRYERVIKPYITLPRLRLDTPSNFSNFAELTAIILVNVK